MQASPRINQIKCGPLGVHWIAPEQAADEAWLLRQLHVEEVELARQTKSERRRLDFLRGRWLFHQVTGATHPLLRGAHGEPLWPAGLAASMSHKAGYVALAAGNSHRSAGIDLEDSAKVGAHLMAKILAPREQEIFAADQLAIAFAAKEAVFKAVFPLTKVFFYFHDFECQSFDHKKRRLTGVLTKHLNDEFTIGTELVADICELDKSEAGSLILAATAIPS